MSCIVYKPIRYYENQIANDLINHFNATTLELDDMLLRYTSIKYGVVFKLDGKTIIIDTHDKTNVVAPPDADLVLKMQYNKHVGYGHNVKPFTYLPKSFNSIRHFKQTNKHRFGFYWQGNTRYNRFPWLEHVSPILNTDWKETSEQTLYLDRLSTAVAALALPGNGNFSHRMIEAFAMHCPVISPVLLNQTKNLIQPNVHYFAVENKEQIRDKYFYIKDNPSKAKEITDNAYDWYLNNSAYPNYLNLIKEYLQ